VDVGEPIQGNNNQSMLCTHDLQPNHIELGAFAKTAPDSANEDRVIVIKALCCTKSASEAVYR